MLINRMKVNKIVLNNKINRRAKIIIEGEKIEHLVKNQLQNQSLKNKRQKVGANNLNHPKRIHRNLPLIKEIKIKNLKILLSNILKI